MVVGGAVVVVVAPTVGSTALLKIFTYAKSPSSPKTISIHRSKEEIADNSLGFQVHDLQIRLHLIERVI